MLAVGFAASMPFSSPMLHNFSDGTPNAVIFSAASSPHPSRCDIFRFSLGETIYSHSSTTFLPQSFGCGDSYLKTPESISSADSSPLDLWLEKLIVLESNGKENIKILDNNGEHSFGCLQFQKGTFEEFGLKYRLITIDDDTDNLIYDCQLQKEIAKNMIEDNYNNWRRWYTSVKIKKLGLPPHQSQQNLYRLSEEEMGRLSATHLHSFCTDWCGGVEKITVAEAKL